MLTPIKKQGDEHIYILLQISVINWISVRYMDILRLVWMLIGSVIVSLNYAASGKSPLCSGASQFAAGYAAAQLSSDKRLSCTVSDDVLSILRAHYKMQINLLFTLTHVDTKERDFTMTIENKKTERLNFSRSVSCGW